MRKEIIYFNEPGPQNTDAVIEAVRKRLEGSRIRYVVVASESGVTALKVAKALKDLNVKVVCVSGYAGIRRVEGRPWPDIRDKVREELENLGVKNIRGNTLDIQEQCDRLSVFRRCLSFEYNA